MSQETTDNFWSVMRDFSWPEIAPATYRLYHDDRGEPLFYTMEDLPGTYIQVDQEIYVSSPSNVRVQDGKLILLPAKVAVNKLRPAAEIGICCHDSDICIVVDANVPHKKWSQRANDKN